MNVQQALDYARQAHEGQVDKAGKPYIDHPIAVAIKVRHESEDARVVALLHDVLEDTPAQPEDLEVLLSPVQYDALIAITRKPCRMCDGVGRMVKYDSLAIINMEDDVVRGRYEEPCSECGGHGQGETYKEYIARLAKNPLARIVKRADVIHNMSPSRAAALPEPERKGLHKRYTWTLEYLDEYEASSVQN